MCASRWTITALCLGLWSASSIAATNFAPGDLRSVGAVTFQVSCDRAVQADFDRGVALLHSFFYEESRRIFASIAERDPHCAMAQWGIAQTWWHPIWAPPSSDEFQAGRVAAERALTLTSTPREHGFIEAIATYYATADAPAVAPVGQSCHGPVGTPARVMAYEQAMQKVADRYPDDFEVRVFNAFAILALGYATPTDVSLSNQKKQARYWSSFGKRIRIIPASRITSSTATILPHWPRAPCRQQRHTHHLRLGCRMRCTCLLTYSLVLACGTNRLAAIRLLPKRRAPTQNSAADRRLKSRNCTPSIT